MERFLSEFRSVGTLHMIRQVQATDIANRDLNGENTVTLDLRNNNALRDAQNTVRAFEEIAHMSSAEMLACEQGDPRLANIDGFDLMDWHYALEQIEALSTSAGSIHAVAAQEPPCAAFPYARTSPRVLANSPEPELQLVA